MTLSSTAKIDEKIGDSDKSKSAGRSILLLAYYYPPQNTSGAARPARFVKYLPVSGYAAHVVSAGFGISPQSSNPNVYPVPGRILFPWSVRSKSGIARFIERKLLPYQEELPWTPFAISQGAEIIRRGDVQAIVSTSPPIASHLAALVLKRRFGIKWIADFRDPLLDNPFRNRKFARLYDVFLEWLIFRHADVLIANTQAVATMWQSRYPAWSQKFRVLWNGFDPETTLAPAALPSRPRKTLSHVGNIYGGRHPGLLVRSLERIIARHERSQDSVLIRLVGPMDQQNMHRWAPTTGTASYLEVLPGTVPEAEARTITATSDYLLLLDLNEENRGLQVPAKLFEYICVGRPILAITSRNSSAFYILARSGVPFRCLYPDMSDDECDREVLEFLDLPSVPTRANDWFWHSFDVTAQTEQLASYLR